MIMVLVAFRRRLLDMVQHFWRAIAGKNWKRTALGGTLLSVILIIGFELRPIVFGRLAFFGLGAALLIEFLQRRRERYAAQKRDFLAFPSNPANGANQT